MKIVFENNCLFVEIDDGYFARITNDDIQVGRSVTTHNYKLQNSLAVEHEQKISEFRRKEKKPNTRNSNECRVSISNYNSAGNYHIVMGSRDPVGRAVRAYRKSRGLSQQEFAYAINYNADKSAISKIERGIKNPLPMGVLKKICKLTKMKLVVNK